MKKKPYSFWRNVGSVALDAVEGAGEGVVGGEVAALIGSAALAALAGSRLSDNALTLVVRSLQGAGFGVVSTLMNSAKSLLEGNKVTAQKVGAQLVSTMVIYVLATYYGDLAAAAGRETAGETNSQTGAAASVQEKYDTAREFFTDEELSDPKSLREAYYALAKQYGVAAQRGDEQALEMMKEVNNAHDAAKAICGLNILTEYQSQKTSGAPTAQTEQKAVQLVNDITADAGAEPSAGTMTTLPDQTKALPAARGFETAEIPGPMNTGKGRFVLNLLTDPQIRAAIDNAWKTGYSNGESLSLPEVASCLTKIIGGSGGNGTSEGAGKTFVNNPFDDAGNLKANIKYQSGEFNYNYDTDSLGRLEIFQTDDLKLTERTDRLPHNPNTPGKLPGDHAGHLAGDRFGGSPDLDNLVSQSSDINLSQYKKIENQWAKAIAKGEKVQTQVRVEYQGNNSRPSKFIVDYSIDGEYFSQTLVN